ncbi:hypothetical protein ACTFIT_007446 [Dictyostelium discoideum]
MTMEFIVSNYNTGNYNISNSGEIFNTGGLNNPLAVIYGYLGCNKSILIGQYSSIWTNRGFNVLIYYPSSILSNYRKGVKILNTWINKYFNENPYSSKVLAFHSISSGANCLAYHLKLMMNDKYSNSISMIKACLFDNISNFNNSILSLKNNLISSGDIFKLIRSIFLPFFIPLWSWGEKNDFKYLISKNNKFHYLVIYNSGYNNNDNSKTFIKTLKQKGNQFNEKNSDSGIILIEKVIHENNSQIYSDCTNQLIDLIIYNYNKCNSIDNYNNNNNNIKTNNSNNNNNNSNIRHQNSKNTMYW